MRGKLPDPGKDFVLAPAGPHLAMCIRVIEMGSQPSTYDGKTEMKQKIRFVWELPQELMDDGKPMLVQQDFNFSMNKKASMRLMLESWRGASFDAASMQNFALENLLGKCCIVNVVHNENNKGQTFANVDTVTRPMKDQLATLPKTSVNEQLLLLLYEGPEAFDKIVFSKLSPKVQERIASSNEYQEIVFGKNGGHDPQTGELYDYDRAGPARQSETMDDEIPF